MPLATCLACLSVGCGSVVGTTSPQAQGQFVHILPPILAEEATVIQHEFVVSNTSQKTLLISEVSKSCSCTEAKMDSWEIPPGGQARLQLNVDLRGRRGEFSTQCVVRHDAGEPWGYRLEVSIYPGVQFVPNSFDVAEVPRNSQIERNFQIQLHNHSPGMVPLDLEILEGLKEIQFQKLDSEEAEEISPGIWRHATNYSAQWKPPGDLDSGYTKLTVRAKDGGPNTITHRDQYLRISWSLSRPYYFDPPRVFFGKLEEDGKDHTISIVLKRHDGQPFTI